MLRPGLSVGELSVLGGGRGSPPAERAGSGLRFPSNTLAALMPNCMAATLDYLSVVAERSLAGFVFDLGKSALRDVLVAPTGTKFLPLSQSNSRTNHHWLQGATHNTSYATFQFRPDRYCPRSFPSSILI